MSTTRFPPLSPPGAGMAAASHLSYSSPRTRHRWLLLGIGGLAVAVATAIGVTLLLEEIPQSWPQAWVQRSLRTADPAQREREQAVFLVRSTLMAVGDANRTGNYAVLRDLAAPPFQSANSPANLASVFAGLRQSGLDLRRAAMAEPHFDGQPAVGADGVLRMRGRLAGPLADVAFALAYVTVADDWRLIEITIATEPGTAAMRAG